jgi:hypothetical protein
MQWHQQESVDDVTLWEGTWGACEGHLAVQKVLFCEAHADVLRCLCLAWVWS